MQRSRRHEPDIIYPAPVDATGIEHLDRLAGWLDDRFRIPGTGIRLGLDGIIGLVPGIGDAATTLVSAYILMEGWRLGVGKRRLARMGGNVALDFVIGLVPLAGDLFDIGFKANRRNIDHIRAHVRGRAAQPPRRP